MCRASNPSRPEVLLEAVPDHRPANKGVTEDDIKKVHALVEGCLQRKLNMQQTCDTLEQLGVDRRFTSLVWRRLEQENPEFFESYYSQLSAMASFGDLRLVPQSAVPPPLQQLYNNQLV